MVSFDSSIVATFTLGVDCSGDGQSTCYLQEINQLQEVFTAALEHKFCSILGKDL